MLLPLLWYRGGLPSPNSLLHNKNYGQTSWYQAICYLWFSNDYVFATTLLNVGDRYVIQWFRGSEKGIYSANYNLIQSNKLVSSSYPSGSTSFLMKAWRKAQGNVGRWLGIIVEWFAVAGIILVGATWLLVLI